MNDLGDTRIACRRGYPRSRTRLACQWGAAVATTLLALGSAVTAVARPAPMPDPPQLTDSFMDEPPRAATMQRGEAVSLQQATMLALQRYPGQLLRAETVEGRGGRREHQIRIRGDDGRVRTVRIDPQTGRFL